MEFPPRSPNPSPAPWRRPGRWLAAVAFLFYAGLLIWKVDACAGGSDSSGYFNHARILATGRVHIPPRAIPGLPAAKFSDFLYSPLGLKPAPDGDGLVPTYPTGLPLLILAARPLAGWNYACDVVMVVHALAGLILTWALGGLLGVPARWRALAVVLLAASPLFLDFALQGMSDVPALTWTTAAAYAAWRARSRLGWALATGLACSFAVLIRPNNVLMAAPLLVAWWPAPFTRASCGHLVRQVALLALGGLPAGIFFCLNSHAAYGTFLTTGYGDTSALFQAHLIRTTLVHYLTWLPALFSPLVLLAVLLPWAGAARRRAAAFLGAWALVYLAFYVSYQFTHETWWYLRFLLPAAPALVLGAGLMAARLTDGPGGFRLAPAAFLTLAALLVTEETYWASNFGVLRAGEGESAYPKAAHWLQTHVPANAILTVMQTSGAVFYYTDFTFVRWDQFDPGQFPLLVRAAAGRPIYAPLFGFEKPEFLRRMPGDWVAVATVESITIWRWTPAASPP